MIVLRPHRLDLFDGGRYGRSIYLDGQHATLTGLVDSIADPAFLSRSAHGTVRVTAALIQRPHTSLVVGGAGLRTVELRADPASPAFLTGTRASVSFSGVTVTGTGPSAEAGRPYLSYGVLRRQRHFVEVLRASAGRDRIRTPRLRSARAPP